MLNTQASMLNEWADVQCVNELDHLFIGNSLLIENCKLIIASKRSF